MGNEVPRVNAMLDALAAAGPHPDHADELMLFGQFVGSWQLECIDYDGDGRTTRAGEWHFGWVLGGRAIQDVWILPTRERQAAGEPPVEHGVSVRFYDPRIDAWQSTWTGPVKGRVHTFVARAVGEDIVLSGIAAGADLRWTFFEIDADSFRWRNEVRGDDGETWYLQQQMHVHRVT